MKFLKYIIGIVVSYIMCITFNKRYSNIDVMFFCSSHIDELWIRSTILECIKNDIKCCLVIKDLGENDDISARYHNNLPILFISYARFIKQIESKLVITASSGIPKDMFDQAATLIHMPHSLASFHSIYPNGTFNGYDILFATGAHHVAEFNALTHKKAYEVGYGKFDLTNNVDKPKPVTSPFTILLAPSWHSGNFLDELQIDLVASLLSKGYRVILRPHPSYFITPSVTIAAICRQFESEDNFYLEDSTKTSESYNLSDVMIADYSGAAYEFALTSLKPVIFVNTAPKILNSEYQNISIPAFEIEARSAFGYVAPPSVDGISKTVENLLNEDWNEPLHNARNQYIYNFGQCAKHAVQAIKSLLK